MHRVILFFLLSVVSARAQVARVGALDVWPGDMAAWPWIVKGELYYAHFRSSGKGVYLYYQKDEAPILITGLSELAQVVRREISDAEAVRRLVGEKFAQRVADLVGPRHTFVLGEGRWRLFHSSDARSRDALQRVELAETTFHDDGQWRMIFFVAPKDGSIERWTLRGETMPFKISDLSKIRVEKEGTLPILVVQ